MMFCFRILQGARAIDADQQGPFSTVEYSILQGPHSDYVAFVTPLEGTLVLKKVLDYETLKNFTIKLRAQDQGTPSKFSDTFLKIIVTDADDQNPKFLRESYRGELPLNRSTGEVITYPESIKAIDQDEQLRAELRYSINPSSEARYFSINPKTAIVSLITPIDLNDFGQITLVIKATQIDNVDRYALATLIISSRKDGKSFPKVLEFIQPFYHTRIREDIGVGSRILAIPTNRIGQHLNYYIPEEQESKFFYVGNFGELILKRSLDFEQQTQHLFHVIASDGVFNATTTVNISVEDVNDWEPRFRETHYEFIVPSMSGFDKPMALGKLEVADGDRHDSINIQLRGIHSKYFNIDSRGILWMKPEKPNATIMHLMAVAVDSGTPVRNTSVPITISLESATLKDGRLTPGVLGAFSTIVALFLIIVLLMGIYIYKS